jgi:hypothetical protein
MFERFDGQAEQNLWIPPDVNSIRANEPLEYAATIEGHEIAQTPENLTWSDLRRDNKESPGSGLGQIMSGNLAIRGSYARQSVGIRPSAVWRRQLHRTRHVRFSGLKT